MAKLSRIVKYVSLALVVCGALTLVAMLIWSNHLDGDFTGLYESPEFGRQFWATFFVGAKLLLAGCLALSATLAVTTALRVGWGTLLATVILLFMNAFMGIHNWWGSTWFTMTGVAFLSSMAFLAVGGLRVGWTKLHSR
jgi:hypothetical protein